MTFNRSIYIIVISLVLSACSTQPRIEVAQQDNQASLIPAQLWAQQQQKLQQLNQWQLQAQLAIISPDSRNSASLFWQQESSTDYQANLTGPFGVHLMTVKYGQGIASLVLDDNKTYRHPSISLLLNRFSPIPIPVNELRYWIIGEPLSQEISLDNRGRVTQALHPQGWKIDYQAYKYKTFIAAGKETPLWLPTKINIVKDDIRIKIAIREWTLNATDN